MYTIFGFLKRPDGMTHEEYLAWWKQRHVPKVLAMPGVTNYAIFPVENAFDPVSGSWNAPDIDGMAIIYFDSRETLEAAMGSSEGRADRSSAVDADMQLQVYCGPAIHLKGMF